MKRTIERKSILMMCALMLTTVSFGEGKMSLPNSSEKPVVQEKAVGPLGDLSPFIQIAKETLKIAESGDLKEAKNRIKDLETAWDDAENKMRPLSSDDWRTEITDRQKNRATWRKGLRRWRADIVADGHL